MRFFLRSKQFKKILSVFLVIVIITVTLAVIGTTASPASNVFGAVFTPIQSAFNSITGAVKDFFTVINDGEKLMQENERLQNEVNRLTSENIDAEQAMQENEFLKNYLEIKESNPDFQFCPASVIAGDNTDIYKSFIINKGSLDSVSPYDPVITDEGLIGYVSEVALSYSKVTTVLSADINIGGKDSRTGDIGVVSGTPELALDGMTGVYNLPRSSSVTVGDYIVTNGGGVFPSGLLIGTITDVKPLKTDISVYGVLKPAARLEGLNDVMVITYFSGQGVASFSEGK